MNKVKVTAATAGLVAALGLSYTSSAYADDVMLRLMLMLQKALQMPLKTPSHKRKLTRQKQVLKVLIKRLARKSRLLKRQLQLLMKLNQHMIKPNNQLVMLKIL